MTDLQTSTGNTSGVKIVEFDGVVETLHGKTLPAPLSYKTTYEELQTFDAIPPQELPDKDDQLSMANARRKANERQKAMAKVVEAASKAWIAAHTTTDEAGAAVVADGNPYEKPTLETSDDLKVKNMVDSMMASKKVKYTREQATAAARKLLGLDAE